MNDENKLTLSYLLQLLEIDSLPGGQLLETFVLRSAAGLIQEHGEDWIREQRGRLVEELEFITKEIEKENTQPAQ
ncbi:hypothetical protein SPSIL_047610 [Sporomusa silvacetica DSM 10669]|uniref:Uncharacterized protein n=1 Tax=Sporomusa silvacetica DSM 10669 TaxID=1123289 RepID=A0ABZ3ISY1_9FIRM|nr:hypothetical protein [Sporomusa silvacetica]OZC14530.1 hypothetical protein SPSIL_46810 [Sporomusa silvacetica DSM 10669]